MNDKDKAWVREQTERIEAADAARQRREAPRTLGQCGFCGGSVLLGTASYYHPGAGQVAARPPKCDRCRAEFSSALTMTDRRKAPR